MKESVLIVGVESGLSASLARLCGSKRMKLFWLQEILKN